MCYGQLLEPLKVQKGRIRSGRVYLVDEDGEKKEKFLNSAQEPEEGKTVYCASNSASIFPVLPYVEYYLSTNI